MATITIDADVQQNKIFLSGDIQALLKNRFAWRYLRDYFNPTVENERIVLDYGENDVVAVLSNLHQMFGKYAFQEQKSASSEKVLNDFFEEEEKFREFSEQALNIRNNNCNRDDFQNFTTTVAEQLRARSLYPLQLLAAYHLAFSQNGCNFSVPGAGKTSIVYGAYAYLKSLPDVDMKHIDKLLIVGPLSSFGPWETEYLECFGKAATVKRLLSNISKEDKENYLYATNTAEITLISYASLSSLLEPICFYLRNNNVMVVLDEAHKAKNTVGGVIAQSVLQIAQFAKSRVVLTGTPAPNGYEDLFNLFKFIWPTKNVIGFRVNQLSDITNHGDSARVDRLIKNISPYFIRIRKSDLGIPQATNHAPIVVPMSPLQQKIYDFIEKKYMESLIEDSSKSFTSRFKASLAQARIIRLMQAASNPAMLKMPLTNFAEEEYAINAFQSIEDNEILKAILEYDVNEVPEKYNVLLGLVNKILSNSGKVVIWATFIYTIHEVKSFLESHGILCQELYGAVPVEKDGIVLEEETEDQVLTRERIVKEFQQDDCPYKVIIANPFAVAESISLHKACHNAIYIERSFNAAHFVQSKDRIHRYGLPEGTETNYYYILSANSVDETIDGRLSEKEKRMIEIMEKMPIPLFDNVTEDLGDEDIKALINDYVRRTKKS